MQYRNHLRLKSATEEHNINPLSFILEGWNFIPSKTLLRQLYILFHGQMCSRTPGDDTRAEGRNEKAQLLKGARPPTGQTAHRSRKDFWPTISCDRSPSPKTKLREGGRVKKRSPNDPARQGGPVDTRAAGTQLADHPMARQYSSLQDSFPILLTRISRDNEAGRFSMGQMKFTKLHIY